MTRQVTGYLAEDGTFFETEELCKHYEAVQNLYRKFKSEFEETKLDANELQTIFQLAILFVKQNKDDVITIITTEIVKDEPTGKATKTGDGTL